MTPVWNEISLNFSWNGFTKIEVLGRVWNVKLEFPIHTYTCAFSNLTRRRRRWHSFFNLIRVHSAEKKRNFLPFTINNVCSNATNWVNNTHIFFRLIVHFSILKHVPLLYLTNLKSQTGHIEWIVKSGIDLFDWQTNASTEHKNHPKLKGFIMSL